MKKRSAEVKHYSLSYLPIWLFLSFIFFFSCTSIEQRINQLLFKFNDFFKCYLRFDQLNDVYTEKMDALSSEEIALENIHSTEKIIDEIEVVGGQSLEKEQDILNFWKKYKKSIFLNDIYLPTIEEKYINLNIFLNSFNDYYHTTSLLDQLEKENTVRNKKRKTIRELYLKNGYSLLEIERIYRKLKLDNEYVTESYKSQAEKRFEALDNLIELWKVIKEDFGF